MRFDFDLVEFYAFAITALGMVLGFLKSKNHKRRRKHKKK